MVILTLLDSFLVSCFDSADSAYAAVCQSPTYPASLGYNAQPALAREESRTKALSPIGPDCLDEASRAADGLQAEGSHVCSH